jgi:hypothetical protein
VRRLLGGDDGVGGVGGGDGGTGIMSLRLASVWVSGAGRMASGLLLLSPMGDAGMERNLEGEAVGGWVFSVGVAGSLVLKSCACGARTLWCVVVRSMRRAGFLASVNVRVDPEEYKE